MMINLKTEADSMIQLLEMPLQRFSSGKNHLLQWSWLEQSLYSPYPTENINLKLSLSKVPVNLCKIMNKTVIWVLSTQLRGYKLLR